MDSHVTTELPFYTICDDELEIELTTCKQRIMNLLCDEGLEEFIDQNSIYDLSDQWKPCRYGDEDTFWDWTRECGTGTLKIFSMNIRSLPKHKGELVAYISNLPLFDILVLTEIGARNIDLTANLLTGYDFLYVLPDKNTHGGVGIYWRDRLTNLAVSEMNFAKTCDCPRCEIESLVVDFTHRGTPYTLCALYRHPNGNTDHFTGDFERLVAKFDKKRHWILSGDININLLHYDTDDVQKYLTTLLSFKFRPAIILPTRITSHSKTCIDHIFIKSDGNTHLTPCILYNDISDNLPTAVIIDNRKKVIDKIRSKVRIFGERNCTKFIDVCRNTNWDQLFHDSEDGYTTFSSKIKCIYNDSFPPKLLSRRKDRRKKPWITPGLKISIKHKNRLYKKTLTRKSESLYARYTNCKKNASEMYQRGRDNVLFWLTK